MRFVDMHVHLDLMTNGVEVARAAQDLGMGLFCTTVTPNDAVAARERFSCCPNVRVGAGLHPWWLADGTCGDADIELLKGLVAHSRYVGEVGLDAGKRGAASLELQTAAFERIMRAVSEHPLQGRVISIHAIRSVNRVLDILERSGAIATSSCILHWFSGSSDELWRAVHLGCLFSINEHMLATKRGREYARILPDDRLLLETDAPPQLNAPYELTALEHSLQATLNHVADLRHTDPNSLGTSIAARSAQLLDFEA
ncbi:TatD family hydrolase [uncultured Enorma sp.]|uniref:TatD family hydrolase n=1 Tax=uncultured Enorma sp. TaxID=1714346 RepID=UPI00280641F8|nr:TatD family hydrolase [uncultured Enorma sp.]